MNDTLATRFAARSRHDARFDPCLIECRPESLIRFRNGKESSVTDLWTGIIVGSFGLAVATLLVIGHYRRELTRQRLLRQMDHRHCWDVMRNRR
jgi:hypothetical protein